MASYRVRLLTLTSVLGVFALTCVARLVDLTVIKRDFLLSQSRARIMRDTILPAKRGNIVDRNGHPLAVSAPIKIAWVNGQVLHLNQQQKKAMQSLLHWSSHKMAHFLQHVKTRSFAYVSRHLSPVTAQSLQALHIPGLYTRPGFQRFYPNGAIMAHVVGVTDVDGHGQEGLEHRYELWLRGKPGLKTVLRDRKGHIVSNLRIEREAKPGHDLQLSLDTRIQFAAESALAKAMRTYHAASGTVVVLDVTTGELLAMVNAPSYNPNARQGWHYDAMRNRAVTDAFEMGSCMKPFTVASALMSGKYNTHSVIDTHHGWMRLGGFTIRDDLNFGRVTLQQLLQKSSNIAAAKIMLSLDAKTYWKQLRALGFGERSQSGLPGETAGLMTPKDQWYPSEVAALAYGYGIAVTPLQLAQAYAVLAAGGMRYPVTIIKHSHASKGVRVMPQRIAKTVTDMLRTVVLPGGTGTRARVPGYEVVGKTGTAYIAGKHGYDKKRYTSTFAGYAPYRHPRLVAVVAIRDPKGKHFGALVAAPVFSEVMQAALRVSGVPRT